MPVGVAGTMSYLFYNFELPHSITNINSRIFAEAEAEAASSDASEP